MGSNYIKHGVPVASEIANHNLACYSVPRMMAQLGEGSFKQLRKRCIQRFKAVSKRKRPGAEVAWALSTFRAHKAAAIKSFAKELSDQMFAAIEVSPYARYSPNWLRAGPVFMGLFWLCAAGGLIIFARRDRGTAIFVTLFFVLVMGPATTSHYVGNRLRLPVDLMCIPFAVAFVDAAVVRAKAGWRARRRGRSTVGDR